MSEEQEALYSFKILIHRICLTKFAFTSGEQQILQKPGFKVKFVDFPHLIIMAKSSIYLEDFKEKGDSFITGKKEELKLFNKGKSSFFRVKPSTMQEYLKNYALVIQLKDFLHGAHTTVGKTLLSLDMFLKDVEHIISDDIERFRRNTFRLTDSNDNCVGWFDMSMSILKRPNVYLKKAILKNMKPEELQAYEQDQLRIQKQQSQRQQQQQQSQQYAEKKPQIDSRIPLTQTKQAGNQSLPPSTKVSRQGSFQDGSRVHAQPLSRKSSNGSAKEQKIPQQSQQQMKQQPQQQQKINLQQQQQQWSKQKMTKEQEEESNNYDDDFEVSEMQESIAQSGAVTSTVPQKSQFKEQLAHTVEQKEEEEEEEDDDNDGFESEDSKQEESRNHHYSSNKYDETDVFEKYHDVSKDNHRSSDKEEDEDDIDNYEYNDQFESASAMVPAVVSESKDRRSMDQSQYSDDSDSISLSLSTQLKINALK